MVSQTMKYTPTFTYHAENMPGGVVSNRSRIDSETSGSSEGSRGSGKPPRRRSHRPRGCRGGSNRRRNNSDDKGNKRNNNSNNSNNSGLLVVNNENSRKPDKLNLHSKATKQSSKHQGNPLQNISILGRRTKNFYLDCSKNFEPDNHMYSTSTGPTEYSLPAENNYDMGPFHNNHFDYPAIQTSFSDSSSEGIPDARMFQRHRPMARNLDGSLILPPLPPNAFYNEPIPSGPNPYALKLNNHELFPTQQQQQQQGPAEPIYRPGFMPFKPPHGGTNNFNFQTVHNRTENTDVALQVQTKNKYDYRAERLEKQRQTVVGGSLFATSPRSFLFGLNKPVLTASGSA